MFKARAELERWANASCINGVFLDELDPEAGLHEPMIMDECGLLCDLQSLPMPNDQAQARGLETDNRKEI